MNLSKNGARILKNFEGIRLTAYKCSAGIWTIGVGHTGKVDNKNICKGMTITKEKCDELFNTDIKKFEKYVNDTKLKLNQNQFDALVSFTFNLGPGCLKSLIKNRNINQIANALLLYNKAKGKIVDGLVKRRNAERELFTKPIDAITEDLNNELPFMVKTKCRLNIRTGPNTTAKIIKTVDKGTELKIWAIQTEGTQVWGKNGDEWYCLDYCDRV